ncbi:MAG: TetR/AcrR family transcriptional regulator [Ilumatobacteraceae bacterium]
MSSSDLDRVAGRPLASRRDSRETRRQLVDGVGSYAAVHGRPPARLADVAQHVGVSTATAYRHFASLDDLANAHLARVPEHAVALFDRTRRRSTDPVTAFEAWNRSWVASCLEHASTTVPLRSAKGFLQRRAEGDPLVTYVCDRVAPLLVACGVPVDVGLAVWNVVSDPREVVDLRETLGWSPTRITRHVTRTTLAVRD